jgi:hypothetical protein
LFVVVRLTSRHGVEVSLHGGKDIPGVRATVTVPAELVTVHAAEAPSAALPASNGNGHGPANGSANGAANGLAHGLMPSPLPRRAKPVNGSSTSDIARRLLGEEPVPAPKPPPAEPAAHPDPDSPTERIPLPKRSPGASTFVNPVDTAAGPVDLALPTQQRAAGDSLFLPSESDWWGSVPNGQSAVEETTPIFDEMISAWFRAISDLPEGKDEQWEFASDAGFLTARTVSESQPDTFTESGLPRRNPRQNLVPGSAGDADEVAPVAGADPEELRKRLNNYQRGVTRARDQRLIAEEAGAPPTLDLSAAGWRFAANPADVTASGLPRRPAKEPAGDQPRPDRAAELRGRLGNFQSGLSRGRRSLAELAERARELGDEITTGAHENTPKKTGE